MSRKTSNAFRTTFLTMDGTLDPNNSQLFFRPLQTPLNTIDDSFYSLGAAQSNDPSLRINKYTSNGQLDRFGYLYDTQFNLPPPGKFLIVAGGSAPDTLVYSQDRVFWASNQLTTVIDFSGLAIAYDGFTWVAGGKAFFNTVIYSSNGRDWLGVTGASTILTGQCTAIATNGDIWVAGGRSTTNCAMCFSYDIITWYSNTINIINDFSGGNVACIAQNGILWLAGGNNATTTVPNSVIYSRDGIEWYTSDAASALLNECYALCWNGSIWLAGGNIGGVGGIIYSIDGFIWDTSTLNSSIPTSVRTLSWNGTVFTAGGYDSGNLGRTLAYSYDGINWISSPNTIFLTYCNAITWDGYEWQAVGGGGIATSTDGIEWLKNREGSTILPVGYAIAVNKALPFVTPSGPRPGLTEPLTLLGGRDSITGCIIAYSTDGITWISSPQVASVFGDSVTTALAWNGSIWVAGFDTSGVDTSGLDTSGLTVGFSYDGLTWNVSRTGSSLITNAVITMAWGVDKFIAFGNNKLITSVNGIVWMDITPVSPIVGGENCVIQYNGTRWVLTGDSGRVSYSSDGITWVRSTSAGAIFTLTCNPVVWNGRLWVAAGTNNTGGVTAYSSDGINWLQGTVTYTLGIPYSIGWNGSLFVIGSTEGIGYSYDGITWYISEYVADPLISLAIRSIAWTGTLWTAAGIVNGTNGVVVYSYNGVTWYGSNGSVVVSEQGRVVTPNRVNPYSGNTLPPPVLNQGITTSGGYGIFTSNANNLYKSSIFNLDETNGVIGINQTIRQYTDIAGQPIQSALEISGGALNVNTYTSVPGLYLTASNVAAGSGGRIELNDAVNGFAWRIDNNPTGFNRLKIQSKAGDDPIQLVMDMRNDVQNVGIGIEADTTNKLRVSGNVRITGNLTVNGTKSFLIDHPNPALKDTHSLRHCCVEGPSRGENLYRWLLTTSNLSCIQALPSYSVFLNENWQFFVSAKESFGTGYIILSEDETFFTLHTSEDGIYSVVGIATRKDKAALSFDEKGVECLKE